MLLPDSRLARVPALLRECGFERAAFKYWSPKRVLTLSQATITPDRRATRPQGIGGLVWMNQLERELHAKLVPGLMTELEDVASNFHLAIIADAETVLDVVLVRNPPFDEALLAKYCEEPGNFLRYTLFP